MKRQPDAKARLKTFAIIAQLAVGLAATLTLTCSKVFAQAAIPFSYWQVQSPYLKITTATQTLNPNICSTGITVQTTYGGSAMYPASNLTVTLTASATSGTVTIYSDPSCTMAVSTEIIYTYRTGVAFYIKTTGSTGSSTVTASATGYLPISQTNTQAPSQFIWTGAAGDNIWKTNANWSGGTAPSSSQVAIFDSTCVTYCSPHITQNLSVGGVNLMSGYNGTITQNSGSVLTIGGRGWTQASGTFVGSSSTDAINGNGPLNLSGGTFTSTKGTYAISVSPWLVTGGTFNANAGTVDFAQSGSNSITPGASTTYNNVTFNSGSWTFGSNMTVAGTLNLANTNSNVQALYGATINAAGDVIVTGYGHAGSSVLNLNGSANQKIDASGAIAGTGNLPGLQISSTGGTVTYVGSLIVNGNYTVTSGTLATGAGTLTLYYGNGGYAYTPGTATYGNVSFTGAGGANTVSGTWTVNGSLAIYASGSGNNAALNGGAINAKGDVTITGYGIGGTTALTLNGSTNQKIDASAVSAGTKSNLPALTIASTGGTVSLLGSVTPAVSYVYTSGTISAGTSTLTLYGTGASTFTPGTPTYNNVVLKGPTSTIVAVTNSLNASGSLTFGAGGVTNTVNMPNPGAGYSLTAGSFTINTSTTVNMHGATYSGPPKTNNGTYNP